MLKNKNVKNLVAGTNSEKLFLHLQYSKNNVNVTVITT